MATSIATFYDADPLLLIFVVFFSVVGFVLLFACSCLTIYKCFRNFCKSQTYDVRKAEQKNNTKHDKNGKYMLCPEESGEFIEMEQLATRRNTGTKVMVLDETGHIPPYVLRSRSRDGSIKYTTYYNHQLGCMETEL